MRLALSIKQLFSKHPKRLTDDLQLRFLNRLSGFLSHGYPLIHALEAITWDSELKVTSEDIIVLLKSGMPLDEAFDQVGFHSSISSYLHFVRANSNLTESILKCGKMHELRIKNIKKFKQIIRYPFILLVIFSIIIFFINQQVLPAFQTLLQSSSEAQITINISIFLIELFSIGTGFFLILALVTIIGIKIVNKKLAIDQQLKLFERIPFYRNFLSLHTSFQFATHFSSLIKSGLPLRDILNELAKQNKLPILAYYSTLLITDLNRGFHMSSLLTELFFIEKHLANIFHKNTNVQMLEKDLRLYSEILLEEIQRKIIRTLHWVQPVFYLIIGMFIIFIYMSLMLPMFQLIQTF